jgi:hypothetical protein
MLADGLACRPLLWHLGGMDRRNSRSGGFLLMIAIFAGVAWGISQGRLMEGALAGTLAGVIIAVLLWLVDRRRG